VLLVDGFVYGEGPRWHDGRLWFSDGPAGKVYSAGEAGDVVVEAEVPHASGLGWLPDGTLVVSTLFDAKVYHVDEHGNVIATFDLGDVAASTNDLVVAPDGRAYVDLYQAIASEQSGAIGLVDPHGNVRVVATGLALPNGMGFLPDGSTLVLEVDGSFHMEVEHWHDDVKRARRLTNRQRTVVRCTAYELRHEGGEVAHDLIALGVPRVPQSAA